MFVICKRLILVIKITPSSFICTTPYAICNSITALVSISLKRPGLEQTVYQGPDDILHWCSWCQFDDVFIAGAV